MALTELTSPTSGGRSVGIVRLRTKPRSFFYGADWRLLSPGFDAIYFRRLWSMFRRNMPPPTDSSTLKIEAKYVSETLVMIYQTTRHYNPEDSWLPTHSVLHGTKKERCENLIVYVNNFIHNNFYYHLLLKSYFYTNFTWAYVIDFSLCYEAIYTVCTRVFSSV
jgi:hypothetical protein